MELFVGGVPFGGAINGLFSLKWGCNCEGIETFCFIGYVFG